MKVRYTAGRLSTEFEGDQVQVFGAIAAFQEIFEETTCGKCAGDSLRYAVRENDGNKYHELHCKNPQCRAKLAFGQHKTGDTLFPKRRAGRNDPTGIADGDYLPDRGWLRWDSKAGKAV
jgi:hypothetical protein